MTEDPRSYFEEVLRKAATAAGATAACLWAVGGGSRACLAAVALPAQECQEQGRANGVDAVASPQECSFHREGSCNGVATVSIPIPAGEQFLDIEVHGVPESTRHLAPQRAEDVVRACEPSLRWAHAALRAQAEKTTLLRLVAASREFTSSLELNEVLDRVATQVRRALEAKLVSILLEHDGMLELAVADGAPQTYLARGPVPVTGTIAGKVLQSGMPLVIEDVRREPGFLSVDLAVREGLCALVCIPLRGRERNLGVLNVYSGEPRRFDPQEVEVLAMLGQLSAAAIENARLYREAREAGEYLRESDKLAALGRLAAGLAHEIKNPLNTMAVLLYAMRSQASGDPQALADFNVIESEIRRLSLLVDQFLDFARPRPPQFCRQDVAEIVEETLMLVRAQAAREGVRLVWRARERPALVWADGAQLKQVFLNLALNAMQAMSGGGTLSVAVQRRTGGVVVEFTDTGRGMSAEVRQRIFEPFFTTRRGGHGLGLAISLRIVESHSGRLWLDSRPGHGTTATVWLPA
ncbi:MAG: hypothetical protein KatS3mg077_1974 [Candidatus Binatia bacterium]|nr:MAG: hypothetical protein KatS3mg077_1974 [Candidatus Binatia bacterium]